MYPYSRSLRENLCTGGNGRDASTPMRIIFAGCCARAATGHAAAPPTSVMKSRRCTAQYLPCFQTKGIAHLGTAALRDFNPVYFSRITSRIDDLTKRLPELIPSSVPTKRSVRDGWKRWRRLANRRDVSASP
jgi:hypothetical protein